MRPRTSTPMRDVVSIVLVVGIVALLLARALKPLFGIDPVGSFFDTVYGDSSRGLLATVFVLLAVVFLLKFRRWRRHPEDGFPWWDFGFNTAILIGLIIGCFIYADQLL
jgi:hypothetical protein